MRVGSDIQSLAELKSKTGIRGNRAIFTEYERSYCEQKPDPWSSLGGLLCAKEACIKALDGLEGLPRYSFVDLEIRHTPTGRPMLCPGPGLLQWMEANRLRIDVSISHSADYVTATVIASVVG